MGGNSFSEPSIFNTCMVVVVIASGAFLAVKVNSVSNKNPQYRFLFYSYISWWLAWAVWGVMWGIMFFPFSEEIRKLVGLGFSDLNSVIIIVSSLFLVRRTSLSALNGFFLGIGLLVVAAISYTALHAFFGFGSEASLQIHENLSLCLAAASPVVFSWALSMRCSSYLPLGTGLMYSLLQAVAFEAFLHGKSYEENLDVLATFASALFLLGIMKIVWAIVITRYFLIPTENLGKEGFFNDIPWEFWAQTAGLTVASIGVYFYLKPIGDFLGLGATLGIIGTSVATLKGIFDAISKLTKRYASVGFTNGNNQEVLDGSGPEPNQGVGD